MSAGAAEIRFSHFVDGAIIALRPDDRKDGAFIVELATSKGVKELCMDPAPWRQGMNHLAHVRRLVGVMGRFLFDTRDARPVVTSIITENSPSLGQMGAGSFAPAQMKG